MGDNVMRIVRYGKTQYWAMLDVDSTLICLCVYRKGAEEVVRRLQVQEETYIYEETRGSTWLLATSTHLKI